MLVFSLLFCCSITIDSSTDTTIDTIDTMVHTLYISNDNSYPYHTHIQRTQILQLSHHNSLFRHIRGITSPNIKE